MDPAQRKVRLLVERMGTIPGYMTLSDSQVQGLVDSFFNIFETMRESIKLLGNTLVLNFEVIRNSIRGDKAKVKEAFKNFDEKRRKYDKDVKDNLKYFRKFYEMEGIDGLGGYGPSFLLFAANPLMYATMRGDSEKGPEKTVPEDKGEEQGKEMHPDVKRALEFFGYTRGRRALSEVASPAQSPQITPEVMEEVEGLQEIARSYVENEKKIASEVLAMLSGRVAFIKKVAEAKNFEELKKASADAANVGIKWDNSPIESSYKKIKEDLVKKQKEDPTEFAKSVTAIKKMMPELASKDGVEAIETMAFGMAKSQVQSGLVESYNNIVNDVKTRMGIPTDEARWNTIASKLQENDIGREYLKVLQDFLKQLDTGKKEVEKLKK